MTALVDVALPLAGGSVSPGRGGIPPWPLAVVTALLEVAVLLERRRVVGSCRHRGNSLNPPHPDANTVSLIPPTAYNSIPDERCKIF